MVLIPVKTPWFIKQLFSNYIWDITTDKKVIYLTFDDGPTPEITNWILTVLKEYDAKATFFCLGNNIEKYPEIFKKIVVNKHSVGNHTYNHIEGWKTNTTNYLKEVAQTQAVINKKLQDVSKYSPSTINLFRPPFGKIKNKQGKALIALGYKIIMWDVLSFDWKSSTTNQACFKNVISKTKNGSIVVFHDSLKASEKMQYTLPKILEHFSKKGYTFKALS